MKTRDLIKVLTELVSDETECVSCSLQLNDADFPKIVKRINDKKLFFDITGVQIDEQEKKINIRTMSQEDLESLNFEEQALASIADFLDDSLKPFDLRLPSDPKERQAFVSKGIQALRKIMTPRSTP